ncbi:hypothetical protein [Bradyrhizobium sp. CCGB01]|uniref:hypothetical protein n=1 Tax=Bradyrhizobium sp. CCGB01 TaxID=2949634 RepID=UPI0020B1858B|nr:hypothetical protein [Bradyrhizobium sp. CCGB01]MCP3405419.1 hypothetical protein [Bradyrhizobium sp. CCGB01]
MLGILLRDDVIDHEINVSLPLAFDSVALRHQSRTHRARVARKPLPFTVVAAHVSLDQPRMAQFLGHAAEHKPFDVAQVYDPAI